MMLKIGVTSPGGMLAATMPVVAVLVWTAGTHPVLPSAAVMAAVMVASLLSSVAGFAFSAICGAMLFHLMDDRVQVVQIMLLCSMVNQASMVHALRREIDWRGLRTYLLGGLLGLPLGVFALLHAPQHVYMVVLGAVLLAYGVYMLCSRARTVQWDHPALDFLAGFFGGISGGAAAVPSAAVMIWCGLRGWDKRRQRAILQPFILVLQIATLLLLAVVAPDAHGGPSLSSTNLFYAAGGLIGTQIGMAVFSKMSNAQFRLTVNLLLIISGASFVV